MTRLPEYLVGLRCLHCGETSDPEPRPGTCARCGGIQDVVWDDARLGRRLDRDTLARRDEPSVWRYHEVLPVVDAAHRTPLRVGGTPLYRAARLGAHLGLEALWVKDDGLNPTGSYKDRASAVGVGAALDVGASTGACASTGNAASSFAGMAASMGLPTVIFVPRGAPEPKIVQLLVYGSRVFRVAADYDATWELAEAAVQRYGWYDRNAAVNPYLVEGKKTAALEICEQTQFDPPDVCAVSVGDGCTIGSLYKGFTQARALGWISRIPRLLGVQAAAADPLVRAFESGTAWQPVVAGSYADSINVGHPRNAARALHAVRESGGHFVRVGDAAIREAQRLLGRWQGIFGEPAGVAALAGIVEARQRRWVDDDERIAVIMTGNGLKDVEGARTAVGRVEDVEPDLEALDDLLKTRRE